MRADEARDAGRATGTTLRQATKAVQGAHQAVHDTVHDALATVLGPLARPLRFAQDTVTAGVYAAVGLGLDAGARAAGHLVARRLPDDPTHPSVHDGPAAHHVLAIGAGLYGHAMARETVALAPALQVRRHGIRVEPTAEGLAQAFPDATPALAVFLHGWCETETAWRLGAAKRPSYAARLHADLDLTPVMLRYNTGLRVAENSASLAQLVADLVAGWPVPVERLVLIGHSMGGLVVHGALDEPDAATWLPLVTDTIALGTPFHGAPLARGVEGAAQVLGGHDKGRWLAEILHLRSHGLRDLQHGRGRVGQASRDAGGAGGIRHHAVVAVTGAGRLPADVAGRLGDLLVPHHSAAHASRDPARARFADERLAVVAGVGHLGLLNHDEVYRHLHGWLAPPV